MSGMNLNPKGESAQLSFLLESPRQVFEVTELNAALRDLFDDRFRGISVAGEISGCRPATSGHFYFSLKDSQSQVKCVLFKGAARFVKFKPRDGMAVIARGNLDVYEARGEYQLIVESLEPRGAGALQIAFEQLKKRLAAEGLFEQARKRPLPKFPQRIGIVTSPAGAVIRDILHVLERRFPGLHLRLFPALVQGEGSIEQVVRGLRYFSEGGWAEVVIVARGGGSLEDLWTFNEEAVARAIVASAVPVISAIGHETDFTIADFVADLRAATPSAAAEIAICTRDSLLETIAAAEAKMRQAVRYKILSAARDLHQRGTERVQNQVQRGIARRAQRLDELDHRLRDFERGLLKQKERQLNDLAQRLRMTDLRLKLSFAARRLDSLDQRLVKSAGGTLERLRSVYQRATGHLGQLSPLAVLSRGYAILEKRNRGVVRSSQSTSPGEVLHVRLAEGELNVAVVEKLN